MTRPVKHGQRMRGIPVRQFKAEWRKFGKQAGVLRNIDMAHYANALIAVWDGKSPGTMNMINVARRRGLEVFVWIKEIRVENPRMSARLTLPAGEQF